ncbi:DMT family transporter [Dietzia sp. 179-F 9C3 NHS]|uniref:DMT family transporter n=1 Tax=Dietzia sp. 179-F 9C3 NHS TaxID=3374295 RepID=UPI00387A8127
MTESWLAVVLALASALSQAFGTVLRHRPAERRDLGHGGRFGVLTSTYWWTGMGISAAGFAFQGAALAFGSLILVQTLTVLSLTFALPLGAWFTGRRVTKTELFWGHVLAGCVAILVVHGRPTGGEMHPPWHEWVIACGVGAVAIGAVVRVAYYRVRGDRALLLGVAGGTAFAYVALFIKGVADRFALGGVAEVVTTGELYGLVGSAVVALTLQQMSFSAGAVHQAVPASTVTTPVVALLLGFAVLDERFAVDGAQLLILALTVVVMAVATVLLSRKEVGPKRPSRSDEAAR